MFPFAGYWIKNTRAKKIITEICTDGSQNQLCCERMFSMFYIGHSYRLLRLVSQSRPTRYYNGLLINWSYLFRQLIVIEVVTSSSMLLSIMLEQLVISYSSMIRRRSLIIEAVGSKRIEGEFSKQPSTRQPTTLKLSRLPCTVNILRYQQVLSGMPPH